MKKYLIAILLLPLLSSHIFAQENFSQAIGVHASVKMGINGIEPPSGRKNGIAFNGIPDFGMTAYIPVTELAQLAAIVDIGYSSYSYVTESDRPELPAMDFTHKYSYLSISPKFYFSSFLFGFKFGMPLSAEIDGAEVDTEQMQFLTEVIIGGMFPLYNDETGRFNLYIEASYMLTGIYNDYEEDDPFSEQIPASVNQSITDAFNPRVASVALGFNYMFNF